MEETVRPLHPRPPVFPWFHRIARSSNQIRFDGVNLGVVGPARTGDDNGPMVQSVELLLDSAADAAVRAEWEHLLDADLPSQARHRGASNRPHVTLAVAAALTRQQDAAIAGAMGTLPMPVTLGGLLIFGSRSLVLARAVVPSADLLAGQARIGALADPSAEFSHQRPGRWTPHVTLARRVRPDQLAAAIQALDPLPDLETAAGAVRRGDGDRNIEWGLVSVG